MPHYPDSVYSGDWIAAVVIAHSLMLLHSAWIADNFTQRFRYFYVALAVVIAIPTALMPIFSYGLGSVIGSFSEMRRDAPVFGWVISLLYFSGWCMPLFTALTVLHVKRHPGKVVLTFWKQEMIVNLSAFARDYP